MIFWNISHLWKTLRSSAYTNISCVVAGINTLIFFSDGLGAYIFRRKIEKVRRIGKKWIERCIFPTSVGFFVYNKYD